MILVDTSAWIGLLRNVDRPAVHHLKWILDSETTVALTPLILQEILQGARSDVHFVTLQRYFADLPLLVSSNWTATHIAAAHLYGRCRWAGVTPRSSNDCLIARQAVEHDVALLHDDRDFEAIARVEPQLQLFTG
ncbi:MAG: PIN domain nuclease [Candidatus Competibacteraceae bacterium]|nr:MAG: PIN domain nuclease [Candidatus Competibacteraceae bacterium]